MTWDFYETGEEFILKEKEVKKEFFGQDFTKLGELVGELKSLNFIKSDDKLKKKMKGMDERNVDIVASASKLRKEYELLYRQLRDLIYPKGKKEEKK